MPRPELPREAGRRVARRDPRAVEEQRLVAVAVDDAYVEREALDVGADERLGMWRYAPGEVNDADAPRRARRAPVCWSFDDLPYPSRSAAAARKDRMTPRLNPPALSRQKVDDSQLTTVVTRGALR